MHTLSPSPQRVAQILHFADFADKTDFSLTTVCYEVFLYYNILQQYCSKISGLYGATMLAENITVQPYRSPQINSPTSKGAEFDVIPVSDSVHLSPITTSN